MHAHKLRAGIIYIYSGGLDEHLLLPLSPSTLRSSVALNSIPFPADEHPPNRAFSQSGSFPLRPLYRLGLSLAPSPSLLRFLRRSLFLFLFVYLFSLSPSLSRTHERTHAVVSIGHANPGSKWRRRHYLVIINIDFIAAKICNRVSSTLSYGIVLTRASRRILSLPCKIRAFLGSRLRISKVESRKYSH